MKKSIAESKADDQAYSSYHGRVHNHRITVNPDILRGRKVYTNSVCGRHVVIGDPENFTTSKKNKY